MKLFADHFRDQVVPGLRNLARAEAACVAHGVETFSGAYDAVMDCARRYGALYLPEDKFADLEDWIGTIILEAIDGAEAECG